MNRESLCEFLFLEFGPAIKTYLRYRHQISDSLDYVADEALWEGIQRYLDWAGTCRANGSQELWDNPCEHSGVLFHYCGQRAIDLLRPEWRRSKDTVSIDESGGDSAGSAFTPQSSEDIERQAMADEYGERIPMFFVKLDECPLATWIRDLRRVAAEVGCDSLEEGFEFIHDYIFKGSMENYGGRSGIDKRLGWFHDRLPAARHTAHSRLRRKLQALWLKTQRDILFRGEDPRDFPRLAALIAV